MDFFFGPTLKKTNSLTTFNEPPRQQQMMQSTKVTTKPTFVDQQDSQQLMDQAIEITRCGMEAKKNKQYKLAKTHLINSAEMMINILRMDPNNPNAANWKEVLKATMAQAEEANLAFKAAVETEKKDKYSLEVINNILDDAPKVSFDDVAGLQNAKSALQEALIFPSLRPDLFTGLRAPPKGILLYGPPGNGKTMLAKAAASECKSSFINISASTLVSKYVGDSEKMMRALFRVAALYQPSIIFIDEIDSILMARSEDENESSRRLKTEFLVQTDGIAAATNARVILIAATNRPGELDTAALRRFPKRILIGMPDATVRLQILTKLLKNEPYDISDKDLVQIAKALEGYSAADITSLVKEAAMESIRELKGNPTLIMSTMKTMIRPINKQDFQKAMKMVPPSVDYKTLKYFKDFEAKIQQ